MFETKQYIEFAEKAAKFSPDPHTKVGAVIVNEVGRIVCYGYNDFPRGIENKP